MKEKHKNLKEEQGGGGGWIPNINQSKQFFQGAEYNDKTFLQSWTLLIRDKLIWIVIIINGVTTTQLYYSASNFNRDWCCQLS